MIRRGWRGATLATLLLAAAGSAAAPGGVGAVPGEIVLMGGKGRQIAFIAEKSTQRFHVYEWVDGHARHLESLPCTTGKVEGDKLLEGDLKTPEGVYRFTRYIDGRQLPPLYGAGAFVMDYPNPIDVLDRKTGSGIWMHGVETDARVHVARDTRGCVALANPDLRRMRDLVRLHDTPIVVVEKLELASRESVARAAAGVEAFLEHWRREWESKDMDAYISRYASSFVADGRDRRAWERHKRALAAEEGARRIELSDVTILREKDRWWVSFRQEYSTAGHRDVGQKTLLLRGRSPSELQIVSERWRSLDDRRPPPPADDVPPALSRELLAAIAPDAAATAPAKPAETAPAPVQPAASPIEAAAAAPEPPMPATAPPEGSPAEELPRAPVRAALAVHMEPPRADRGTFALYGAHVRREGESLLVQVQLLNLRATSVRAGALVVSLPSPPGLPPEPPRPEPFAVKQGRLISLSLPDADLPLRVGLLVRDEAGKVALDRDLVIEAAP